MLSERAMRPNRTLFALIMLGALASCYPPTQSNYSPTTSERDRTAIAVYAGVHIPARSGSTAPGLSIVEEFADDAREDAGTVSNRGEPSLYSRQEVAESQSRWVREGKDSNLQNSLLRRASR